MNKDNSHGHKKRPAKKQKSKKQNIKEMPFLDHLEELRWRILKSLGFVFAFFIIAMPFSGWLLNKLTWPNDRLEKSAELIFLKPTGMLVVRMEIALVAALIAASGFIFIQFWNFVSPGMLQKEKKYFIPSLFFTIICFLTSVTFAYGILIPTVLPFLYQMGTESIKATINITEYISFCLRLILVAGLIFELPILSFFLSRIGLLTPSFLKKYRRYGIVLVFVFSAIVTPPDPMSQVLMAVPLLILYQISIWISMIGYKQKKASDAAWEDVDNENPYKNIKN